MRAFPAPISEDIWMRKYRFGHETGIDDSRIRVARAVAAVEPRDHDRWAEVFAGLLADDRFCKVLRLHSSGGCLIVAVTLGRQLRRSQ